MTVIITTMIKMIASYKIKSQNYYVITIVMNMKLISNV